jgi:hypothetical protein
VSALVWTNLITAAATVTTALGGVWLKGRYDARRDASQAQRAEGAACAQRRDDAYADLAKTARLVLQNFRQIRIAYATGTFLSDDPVVKGFFDRTGPLSNAMHQATAVAELRADGDLARARVRGVYDAAEAVAAGYTEYVMTPLEGRMPRRGQPPPFDAAATDARIARLVVAIDEFIDAVRPPAALSIGRG